MQSHQNTFPVHIQPALKYRVNSIDLLRGLVMIIMALDHVRDFFHTGVSLGQDPLDLKTTWPGLFFTRWITHFCAPVFVFLSGAGIFLYSIKKKTKNQVAFFLFTRGIWLIIAEVFLINLAWSFDIHFTVIVFQVIWAIGMSMIFLAFLQYLPYKILLALGLLLVFGHNLFDNFHVESPRAASFLWSLVHNPQYFQLTEDHGLFVFYPFVPWLGLMICGYCLGKLYTPSTEPAYRKRFLRITGFILVGLFIIIRLINYYGDHNTWQAQPEGMFTFLDFMDTTKYPPSLLYMLMTIGPALIFLSYAEGFSGWVSRVITVFGKVPFFYYFLHILLIHLLRIGFFILSGEKLKDGSPAAGSGYPLWVVYLVWLLVIIILYFPSKWYSRYKATHNHWWLSYI